MSGAARHWIIRIVLLAVAVCVSSCAHTVNTALCRTGQACGYDPASGYRFHPEWKPDRETLTIVTLSGGGTRAAALAYGALSALAGIRSATQPGSLLDNVDVMSSVSGGSMAAAWYALHGSDGFVSPGDAPLLAALRGNGTLALALRTYNPLALAGYLLTPYQRSDVLAGYFDTLLLHGATYADVEARYRRNPRSQGFVILNATDLGHETRFPFTQNRFDFICSDLSKLHLADALAASADFPFAFSAVGIGNHSPCGAEESVGWTHDGPRLWLQRYDRFDLPASARPDPDPKLPTSAELRGLRDARVADAYIDPIPGDRVLHLLDGGLVDNLGIQSALDLDDDPKLPPGLDRRIGPERSGGYANVRRLLFVVVNARTKDPTGIDAGTYPPDEFSTARRVVDTPLSSAVLDTQSLLSAELQAATGLQPRLAGLPAVQSYLVTVDFEFIPDATCRQWFWTRPTSWNLPPATVSALEAAGRALVLLSPGLRAYRQAVGAPPPGPVDFAAACAPAWAAAAQH